MSSMDRVPQRREVDAAHAAEWAAENRFRLLVESVRDYAIFLLDPLGYVATWNLGAERIKGYAAHEIIGRHFSTFYPPEVAATTKCADELVIATEQGRFVEEGWRVRKDGSQLWAKVTITALHSPEGALVGFAKVTQDLTERKAAEENQRRLAAQTAALLEKARIQQFQERFLAVLGHDLRNPLASIDMGASILRAQATSPMDKRVLTRMHSSAQRMGRMIEQILDLTRSRLATGLELDAAPMDLAHSLTSIVEEVRVARPERHIELHCPQLLGTWDRDRLEQVFSNLIGNAIAYGDPKRPVTVRAQADDAWVEVTVHNHGPTIAPELQEQLFDPFRRGERDSRTPETSGLGLGLYISREIARTHGGDVECESDPLHGTTFRVRLPQKTSTP